MKTRRLIPLLLSLSIAGLTALAADIKGVVTDADGQPLPGAAVQLINLPDSTRAGYMMTADKGEFSFKKLKPGAYQLRTSMTGMDDVDKNLEIKEEAQVIDLGNITLTESAVMLKEAVVTGIKAAVVAKQDTIEFNADSYHTAPNATVNDLLKKLPGVEIDADGSIKSNGKSVTKILVDGKEFFGDDPQMATKNLPSNMVDRVQVVDRKSDLARMTGVDDGEEETVINLTVKKDMNNGWFGTVGAGYGTDDRYQGSFSVNHFKNGNQLSIVGGANNINDNGSTDRGRGRFTGFGNSGGINRSQRIGINFNVGNDEIFRVGGNVNYSHTDRTSTKRSNTQYLFPDSVSYQNGGSRTRDRGHNISSDFRMQWNINDNNTVEFRPNFSISFRDALNNDSTLLRAGDAALTKVNRNYSAKTNKGTSIATGGNLIFNHKFASRPGRSFSVNVEYNFTDTHEKSTTWSDIEYFLKQDEDLLYRFIDNKNWTNRIRTRLTWTEPFGDVTKGNFLTFAYRLDYRWNNADKLTYNLPEPTDPDNFEPQPFDQVPVGGLLDETLSNSFRNEFFTQELQVGYKKTSKKYNYEAGLQFSPASSKSEDLINSARNIPERWVFNVAPYARMQLKFAQRTSLRLNYRARTSQPSMSQLQPVADVSNPLNIKQGNPDLKPTFTQNLGVHFNDYRMESQQSFFAMANASIATNTVVSYTETNKETGGRTTTYRNVNGNFNIFGMAMINRPFRNKKWRFSAGLRASFAANPGYINGDFNRTDNLTLSPDAGLTFSCDVFQMTVRPNYSLQQVHNTLPQQADRTNNSFGFFSDASLYLPFGLQLNTDLRFSKNTGLSAGYDSQTLLWNAELSYSVLSSKALTFSVRAYDLLGQTKNISRSVSANSIVDSEYNDLTRYIMFGVSYTFNTLSKKGKGPKGEDMDTFGPPPGMGGRRGQGPPPGMGGRRGF